MLNSISWDRRIRRLAVGSEVVRVVWSADLDPSLLIATTSRGERLDLLVVPHLMAAPAAERAMAVAADPKNTGRAPTILAITSRTPGAGEQSTADLG